jgi:hypothetical protein
MQVMEMEMGWREFLEVVKVLQYQVIHG